MWLSAGLPTLSRKDNFLYWGWGWEHASVSPIFSYCVILSNSEIHRNICVPTQTAERDKLKFHEDKQKTHKLQLKKNCCSLHGMYSLWHVSHFWCLCKKEMLLSLLCHTVEPVKAGKYKQHKFFLWFSAELQLHFQIEKDTMTGLQVCGSSLLNSEGFHILADVMNF